MALAAIIPSAFVATTLHGQIITSVAGTGMGGYAGDGGPALSAEIHNAYNITPDASGNLYIADYANYRVRKVSPTGVITTVAGNGTLGYSGDGGQATDAQLNCPACVAIDSHGNLYIADMMNSCIRKITPAGIISTVVGNGTRGYSGDGGPATAAQICFVYNVVVDAADNIYIPDEAYSVVRKVNAAGIISTIAGNGTNGNSGDGGPATAAQLSEPWSVALDNSGNVLILDLNANVVRKVNSAGIISTIAGIGGPEGYSGDGGPATAAQIAGATCIIVDHADNIYIADYDNSRIRKINAAGIITTVVGTGTRDFAGDGGLATAADINFPTGIALDASNNLYISDLINERIRKVAMGTTSVVNLSTQDESIKVFPNPNNGNFTLQVPGTSTANITITDFAGRTVATRTSDLKTIAFDISTYAPGAYILNVVTDGKTYNWKIVKE